MLSGLGSWAGETPRLLVELGPPCRETPPREGCLALARDHRDQDREVLSLIVIVCFDELLLQTLISYNGGAQEFARPQSLLRQETLLKGSKGHTDVLLTLPSPHSLLPSAPLRRAHSPLEHIPTVLPYS